MVRFSMEESWFPNQESWFPIEETWFPIEKSWFYNEIGTENGGSHTDQNAALTKKASEIRHL